MNYKALNARGERCADIMSNLFKRYMSEVDKECMRYIQHQMYKYDDYNNIYKDTLVTLALNKYKNMCIKYKWLANSPEEQHSVLLSTELVNMKYINLKLANAFKSRVTLKGNINNQVNQKGDKKKTKQQNNDNNFACKKVLPKKGKKETKTMRGKTYNWCKWH